MEQQINAIVIYLSSAVFVGLVSVLAFYLYSHKKKEGISYRAAIFTISNFVRQRYSSKDAVEQFCEEYDIPEKQSFLQAIQAEGSEVLIPQTIAQALNKIGYKVHLVNKVYYIQD